VTLARMSLVFVVQKNGFGRALCTTIYSLMTAFKFGHAGENATTNAFDCDVAKEPFEHVEPGRAGRCEMDMKAWVLGQPSLDLWVLVGCVVIHDQGGLAKWQSVLLEILAR